MMNWKVLGRNRGLSNRVRGHNGAVGSTKTIVQKLSENPRFVSKFRRQNDDVKKVPS
jgi:hypothetical protein